MKLCRVISLVFQICSMLFRPGLLLLAGGIIVSPQLPAATTTPGRVVGWGNNTYGQTTIPAGLSNVIAVGANGADNNVGYSVALTSAGTVTAWGCNFDASGPANVPPGLCNVVAISAGAGDVLALKSDGTVVAWGGGLATDVPADLSNVVAVAAGRYHSLALKNDGTVVAWGFGLATNVPSGLNNVVAVAAGWQHSLAVKNDGTVVAWGSGTATNVPAGLRNVVAVAAGNGSSLALKSDSTVVGWSGSGANVPAGLSNVVAIAPTIAIKDDGTLVSWSSSPPARPPTGLLSNIVAIAVGVDHYLAITVDLKINSIEQTDANPALRFHTFSGRQYSVEYSTDLSPGSWVNLPGGGISGNGFDVLVTDTNAVAAARFYRLRQE